MTQDALKTMAARAALEHIQPGDIVGVGTGSTVNHFIEALASMRKHIEGAISSSEASTARMQRLGIPVLGPDAVHTLNVYVDGADEIDPRGCMTKGGGAALTREKIVAAMARKFVCIVDETKQVKVLGKFPVPVEIIPMACTYLGAQFERLGGRPHLRRKDGAPVITDNHMHIVDVAGLKIADPLAFESMVNQWPGIVTVGVFAHQKADVCLVGSSTGVKTLLFDH